MAQEGRSVGLIAAAAAPFAWLGRVLGTPELRRPLLGGLVVAALIMVAVFGGLIWGTFALVDAVVGGGGWFWTTLGVALKLVGVALAVLASPVLFTVLTGIVASSQLGTIHERARALEGGAAYPERGARAEAGLALRGVGWSLRRLGRFALLSLGVLVIGAVPIVGVVAIALELLVAAYFLTWELLTPHFEARGLSHAEQKRFLRRRPGLVLGLGGAATLLLLIPFAQPLVLFGNQAATGALTARLDPN